MLAGMGVHWQRIAVPFDYPVYFTRDAFAPGNRDLLDAITRKEPARRHRLLFVVDDGVAAAVATLPDRIAAYVAAHPEHLTLAAPPIVVPGGEAVKNDPAALDHLQRRLQALGMDRQSIVVIVGGGAVLDMVGYAAATTHRGIRVVRLPTTVLGQNDSGVSVKNGINAFGAKNFLGTFAPPFAVVNDRDLLVTLPRRDVIAGMAEAVKVAVVRDAEFFAWNEVNAAGLAAGDLDLVSAQVERSARLHLTHIATSGDPFELGSARPLDFGHWAAHKLDILSDHRLRHGEAVAIGMALDARYAVEAGLLRKTEAERLIRLLEGLGFRLFHPALLAHTADGGPALLRGLDEFREHLGGLLCVTMMTGIGRAVEVDRIDRAAVMRAAKTLAAADHAGEAECA
jgi:3-dehydroquinate synthase